MLPDQTYATPRAYSKIRLKEILIAGSRAWLMDSRSLQFVEWIGKSGISQYLTSLRLDCMMVLDDRMLAAVESTLRACANTVEEVLLGFGPEVEFTRRALQLIKPPDIPLT